MQLQYWGLLQPIVFTRLKSVYPCHCCIIWFFCLSVCSLYVYDLYYKWQPHSW